MNLFRDYLLCRYFVVRFVSRFLSVLASLSCLFLVSLCVCVCLVFLRHFNASGREGMKSFFFYHPIRHAHSQWAMNGPYVITLLISWEMQYISLKKKKSRHPQLLQKMNDGVYMSLSNFHFYCCLLLSLHDYIYICKKWFE